MVVRVYKRMVGEEIWYLSIDCSNTKIDKRCQWAVSNIKKNTFYPLMELIINLKEKKVI